MVSYRGEGLYLVMRRNTTLGYDGKTQNVNLLLFRNFYESVLIVTAFLFISPFLLLFILNLVILRDIPLLSVHFLFKRFGDACEWYPLLSKSAQCMSPNLFYSRET